MTRSTTKTVVVTGASAGIGLETARGLALRGHRVLLVGRNKERTPKVAAALRLQTNNPQVESFLADFSSLASVRDLAARLTKATDTLDVLVNNAGVWHQQRQQSEDGFEDSFAVNHLAPFLLTLKLVPLLARAPSARVVTVSSRLHEQAGAFDFEDLDVRQRRYDGLSVYARTKLAGVLFAGELAKRLATVAPQVTSNAVHPGAVNTEITRDSALLSRGIRVVAPWLKTAKEGAETTLYAATHPALARVTGAYFADSAQCPPSPHARDDAAMRRLWDLSLELTQYTAENSALGSSEGFGAEFGR